jgi:BirA family biotin operon repressor/biotin-[acetyl-CoA-carboxylase] ligase
MFVPKIIRCDSVTSTNTEAASYAERGAVEGLTVVAAEQTAGRGRLGRSWISPPGAGLYASIVLRPRIPAVSWSLVPLMAAVAVHDALLETVGLTTDIKWPNDILVDDRKICGILAETIDTVAGRSVVLGIGINLTSEAFPPELRGSATSIAESVGRSPDSEMLLESLLRSIGDRYAQLQLPAGPASIVSEWCRCSSYAEGKMVRVTSDDETFTGITRGVQSDGALRVETANGEIRIVHAADVARVRNQLSADYADSAEGN